MFSGSENGEICVFNVQKEGKEKFTAVNASFKVDKKIRKIAWANERKEGILGDQDGVITFINEKNGEAICKYFIRRPKGP